MQKVNRVRGESKRDKRAREYSPPLPCKMSIRSKFGIYRSPSSIGYFKTNDRTWR